MGQNTPQADHGVDHAVDHGVDHGTVIASAITHFAARGYADTKLAAIAQEAGMSKRMIHYHFGDKQGLYQQALDTAASQLVPPLAHLEATSPVPVEAVRQLVSVIYKHLISQPAAVQLLARESTEQALEPGRRAGLSDLSTISLHVDKLLMRGQDAGAFRPGISATDVFTIIGSLAMCHTANRILTHHLVGIDMSSEENTAGLERLITDTVLAFLTANIPDSNAESYLVTDQALTAAETPHSIYSSEPDLYR